MFKLVRSRSVKIPSPKHGALREDREHGLNTSGDGGWDVVSGRDFPRPDLLYPVDNADMPSAFPFPDDPSPFHTYPSSPPRSSSASPSSTMAGRPSSSSGVKARGGPKSNKFDKRISRDDMFLETKPSFRPRVDDKRVSRDDMFLGDRRISRFGYHMPNRGQLPTPEQSPGSGTVFTAMAPLRTYTPESFLSDEAQIGVALGSPAHPPSSTAYFHPQYSNLNPAASSSSLESRVHTEPPVQRQKTSKRRFFGIFGGGKKQVDGQKASKGQVETKSQDREPVIAEFDPRPTASPSPGSTAPMRSMSVTGNSMPKHKPIIVRTNTDPYRGGVSNYRQTREAGIAGTMSSRGPAFGSSESLLQQQDRGRKGSGQSTLQPLIEAHEASQPKHGPFLDVEIPDITLERYSVMFGKVLGPQQQNASSLLARRQATLDRLKTVTEQRAQEEAETTELGRPRRASSPQPGKSPALTLFPPAPGARSSALGPRRLSPHMRSNTSPANLPSPLRANFDEGNQAPKEIIKGRMISTNPRSQRDRQSHLKMQPAQFSPDKSSLILDSPTEVKSKEAPHALSLKPPPPTEPKWEIVQPRPPAEEAPIPPTEKIVGPPEPSNPTPAPPRAPNNAAVAAQADDEAETALKAAAEVSIQRQISISREQRRMLFPLPNSADSGPGAAHSAASSGRAKAGSSARASPHGQGLRPPPLKEDRIAPARGSPRLAETKSSTPVLVTPGGDGDPQLRHHRKSERVILEAA